MARHWGLQKKDERAAWRRAKGVRPLATLAISAVYGVIGAAVAVVSFGAAQDMLVGIFHGRSLAAAIVAAGFGCWIYIWIARPRFAAHFSELGGDAFGDVLRFYSFATASLAILLITAIYSKHIIGPLPSVILLCVSGGAAAAATFQTVFAFVPGYSEESST